ncbi:MAG: MarR family winged helix-turn-helix transcriptional regulator [Thermoleophilaceae bacterium]
MAKREICSTVLIAHLARCIAQRFDAALAPLGLRQRQLVALHFLRDHGPAPQQALADALSIDSNNVVLLLNELEQAGLATRRRNELDRRRHIVEISEAGRRALERAGCELDAIEKDLLSALSETQRATLHELLDTALGGRLTACAVGPPEQPGLARTAVVCSVAAG